MVEIRGITIWNTELKLVQFADNFLFFLAYPSVDAPKVFDQLHLFGLSSGLRINVAKSELLMFHMGNWVLETPLPDLPVMITTNHIRYIEILIGRTPGSLYDLNYSKLIHKMVRELEGWSHLPLSFLPRCHLLKMILLYPMQTIPLLLKHADINKMTSAYLEFVWGGKRPCIALKKLMLPISMGGLNVPDIRSYKLASLLRDCADWIKVTSYYSNMGVEAALAAPWPLANLLHTKFSCLPRSVRTSLLLKDTIAAWKICRKSFKLPYALSKHMPLWDHPEFPQGAENKLFKQ